jgi:hypothetical protein
MPGSDFSDGAVHEYVWKSIVDSGIGSTISRNSRSRNDHRNVLRSRANHSLGLVAHWRGARRTLLLEIHEMKRPILTPLLAALALTSCETAHKAAVSTFRVVDAPASYMRRKLGVDEENQQTTVTEMSAQSTTAAASPPAQPYPVPQPTPPPPGPAQTQPPPVTAAQRPPVQPSPRPTAAPQVVQRENPPPSSSPTARISTVSQNTDLPYAKPVPGKPGYVFSPFDKNGGYVDVTGYSPGQKVKDPYSGKIFLVP